MSNDLQSLDLATLAETVGAAVADTLPGNVGFVLLLVRQPEGISQATNLEVEAALTVVSEFRRMAEESLTANLNEVTGGTGG